MVKKVSKYLFLSKNEMIIYPKGHVKILISSGWKRGKKELHHLGRMLNL